MNKRIRKTLITIGVFLLIIVPTVCRVNNPYITEVEVLFKCRLSITIGGMCIMLWRFLR